MSSILIIEDEPAICGMMKMILQMEGFEVRTACDGMSGIKSFREKRPDLILCDILMPEMDGHALFEALKSEHNCADIPFIFVTAMGERADVRRGMSSGADDYLTKPFSAEELLGAVTARLHHHEAIRQQGKSPFAEEHAILLQLTSVRERQVLQMVGHGMTSREIARRLGITIRTAEVHRLNLMRKLDATNAAHLARWAVIAEQMQT